MKKIYYFLQSHKALKILFYIFIVFNVLWYFILNLCLIVGIGNDTLDKEIKKINNVATTPIKEVAKRDNYYFLGSGDMLQESTLDSFLSWCSANSYYSGFVTGDQTQRFYNLLQDSPLTPSTNNMDNIFYISNVGSSGNPTPLFQARRLRLYSAVTNAQNFRQWFYYVGFGNDGNMEEYAIVWYRFTDITGTENINENIQSRLLNVRFTHTLNWQTTPATEFDPTDFAFSFYNGSTSFSMFCNNIINSDNANYWNGWNVGYAEGYQNGLNAAPNEINNGFNLISGAFNAVAGILNLQVLPYLTLGTLVFVPIIVSVIIIVVKMIKG